MKISTKQTVYRQYQNVEERTIVEAILWYKAIQRIFYAPSVWKANLLYQVLDWINKSDYKGHILSQTVHPRAEEINRMLEVKFEEALKKAPELIENAFHYIYRDDPIPEEFLYNYDGIYKGE